MATAQELLDRAKALQQRGQVSGTTSLSSGSLSGSLGTGSLGGGNNIKTSNGLYQLAVQNGLKADADRILRAQAGESPTTIFSGGFISDIFDVLNAAQYGVTGVLKGKSFAEGVRTRQSFTDDDALGEKGIPGIVGGILLDIASDPFTYVAPWTIVGKLKSVQKLKKLAVGAKVTKPILESTEEGVKVGAKTYEGLEGGSRIGQYLTQKFAYRMGKDPVFMETFDRSIRNTAVTTQAVVKAGREVADLTDDIAAKILAKDKTGRFIRRPLEEIAKEVPQKAMVPIAKLYAYIDDLGKQAVDAGLLSKETFEKNYGEYIKQAYDEFEMAKKDLPFGWAKTGVKGIKSRVDDLTPEKMAELGQIDNPAYLLMKSSIDLVRDVENAKLFKAVDTKFSSNVAQEGFVKMPDTARVGALAGKYVPQHMADYLNEVVKAPKTTLEKIEQKLVGNFKFFKVVMNPATHARNIISNEMLNYWKLGMNPLDPRTIKAKATALKEITRGGGKWSDEARPLGYDLNTFASAELKGLLDSPEVASWGSTIGSKWQNIKTKLGDMYQAEENQAKLTAYIYQRTTKGLSPEEAWKTAEAATFNYAQVTPFVRKLRESIFGMPFITFTYKATPLAIETALKHPGRISVIGKIKEGIENAADIEETERERASEPPWVRDGFFIKLPGKDSEGRSMYFDLTYILPFGDLVSGNFFERGQNMETGTPESPANTVLRKSPFLQLVMELGKNKDFFGNSIYKDSDPVEKQGADILRHITKSYVPPIVGEQLPNGYDRNGERDVRGIAEALTENEKEDQKRTLTEELMRHVGMKIQPIDADIQETYTEWNRKKALETLLIERGILDELSIKYQPK